MGKNEITEKEQIVNEGVDMLIEVIQGFSRLHKHIFTFGMMGNMIIKFAHRIFQYVIPRAPLSLEEKMNVVDELTQHFNMCMDNIRKEINKEG